MFPAIHHHLIRLVFPPVCVHCGREGAWLCGPAAAAIAAAGPLIDRYPVVGIDHTVVRGSYDDLDPLKGLVTRMKFQYWHGAREVLPELLEPLISHLPCCPNTVIVPVPLHPHRLRERGFNQSELIAQALAGLINLPMVPLVRRTRYTTSQATLSEHERQQNLRDAFVINPAIDKIPYSVILVDDVLTTGSTFRECAAVLRQWGIANIHALALAKG